MAARLGAHLGEGVDLGAIFLHVREARAAEIAQRQRHVLRVDEFVGGTVEFLERAGAVMEDGAKRAGLHLLEAEHQRAIGRA